MPDAHRKKHFIQTLLSYPWGKVTADTYDLAQARAILEEDHFGMADLKQRILEFIAVAQRQGTLKQKVILLDGPPGVGKTSIAKSIARCLNRAFARISLGGEYDVNIIKGHRKTYVGAYPGKIFQAVKSCKSENPVILLDEIDKIETGMRGNLMESIMEVLDPAQNSKFKDEFLDISIDLSKVLFVCTSNDLASIAPPLRDRMEIMSVSGYSTVEKEQIFSRFIAKKAREEAGLTEDISLDPPAVTALINGYCRESGVRSLQQAANNLFARLAFKKVMGEDIPSKVTEGHLQDLIGLPKFTSDRLFAGLPPPGVMIGLAYNATGGTILYIESIRACPSEPGKGQLTVTGRVAEVMKESTTIAYTYVRHLLALRNNPFL
jgi:Lon-like ATP-dependent protease